MKMRTIILLCLITIIVSFNISSGQKAGRQITITGKVVDGTSASVANAFILIDGEKTNILTNSDGLYKIKVRKENTKIGVLTSTNGMIEEVLDGRNVINFRFTGSVHEQYNGKHDIDNEVVDVGYRNAKKKTITSPVGEIKGNKSKYASYNNIYEMIRGEVPGVSVNGTSIMIRSTSTVNGSTEPLFVVDGVPVNTIDNIVPQEVRSISILKGSSAAIYGSRGSNGVIIINLLRGTDK
jgi:TonB-dependent SusC/RagA subfamily outer membrane receptor